jgi:hypothetical protein
MNTKYPVYIVSKGRWEQPQTANFFKEDGLDFKMIVEPQEYDDYCRAIGKKYILKTDFSNLGVGSYPARNFAWEHSIANGHKRHWIFDDNIRKIRRILKGKKIPCNAVKAIKVLEEFTDRYENIAISGFNYSMFVIPGSSDRKPFYLNTHIYSALLIKNNMPHRWRLKYNEDVDLCLQVLEQGMCTVAFNAFTIDKTSTVAKMKGGNQTDLYKGNAYEKKILKARSLEEIWPQYAETKIRFGRPHHYVQWNKHFKHSLVRRTDIDWEAIKNKKHDIKLKKVKEIKTEALKKFYKKYK